MKRHQRPTPDFWEYERSFSFKPALWRSQAQTLRAAAEYLNDSGYRVKSDEDRTESWPAGIERMLMGYALENLLKALLLGSPRRGETLPGEGKLSLGVRGRDLRGLFTEADFLLTSEEKTWVALWQLCASSAGQYPEKTNRPLTEEDGLSGLDDQDLLRRGVDARERECFQALFDRCCVRTSFSLA